MIKKVVFKNCDFIKLKANKGELLSELAKELIGRPDKVLKKRIEESKDYEGKSFQPLKESTKSIRKSRGYSGSKPLIQTGKLKDTIKWKETKKGGKLSFNKYGWYQAEGFTTRNHFAVKNKSKIIGFRDYSSGVNVPARPFINTVNPGDGIIFASKEEIIKMHKKIKKLMHGTKVYKK